MAFEWNTLHGALEALFPNGTSPGFRGYEKCPPWSTTIFGAAAYLLERGGVYHRIVPQSGIQVSLSPEGNRPPYQWPDSNMSVSPVDVQHFKQLGEGWYRASLAVKATSENGQTAELAAAESELKAILAEVTELWTELVAFHPHPVVVRPVPGRPLPWWLPALKLLIVADEASRDLGFEAEGQLSHPYESLFRSAYEPIFFQVTPGTNDHVVHQERATTFAPQLNPHIARVVPKSRTPAVGCTMRTLSHNLALVPPEGIVDICWYRELRPFPEDREPLNILLVPFPYRIAASAFRSLSQSKSDPNISHRWGWFTIDQTWLRVGDDDTTSDSETVAEFVCDLLDSAEHDVGRVHGVILPEYALDWQTYAAVVAKIRKRRQKAAASPAIAAKPPLDFLVAGVSSDESGRHGNYVATTTFSLDDNDACVAATYRRTKHHRWQLTGSQISDYALSSALDPNVVWWEANEIPPREINLTVFRRGAVFSAMICEDLARSEPCHEPLRAAGPNIVFVILMDGPQVPGRWAARYATTLADDPGSSVLTLTSLGLMERANEVGRHPTSRHIAIWKDDSGQTVQIECPKDAQGVLVTLSGAAAEEATLDGRPNADAQAWRYRGHQPVRITATARNAKQFDRLLAGR